MIEVARQPPLLRSIRRKVLLPAMLLGLAVSFVALWASDRRTEARLQEKLLNRAELVADMVGYVSESTARLEELRRIVASVGAERDILEVVVVGGAPLRVLASSRASWLDKPLLDLPASDLAKALARAAPGNVSTPYFNEAAHQFVLTAPLRIRDPASMNGVLGGGAVLVKLDTRPITGEARQSVVESGISFLIGFALLFSAAYLLLELAVLRPLAAISHSLQSVTESDEGLLRSSARDDEIGLLARSLRESIKVARTEQANAQSYLRVAQVLLVALDPDGKVTMLNPYGHLVLGYEEGELQGSNWFQACIHPEEQEEVLGLYRRLFAGDIKPVEYYENDIVRKDGARRLIAWSNALLRDQEGNIVGALSSGEDITERRRASDALEASELRLRTIIDTEPECVKILGPRGELLEMNAAGLRMLEADSVAEASAHGLGKFVLPEYRVAFSTLLGQVMAGESGLLEFEIVGLHGTRRWLETHAAPLRDASGRVTSLLGVTRDVSERKSAEASLQSSLHEKVALLREVHHRVKNNLQVITSLLRLESGRSEHDPTRFVLGEMQRRIQSMALLHESLYRSGTFASVDLGAYLGQLATQSFRTLIAAHPSIELRQDLASVRVAMDQALPCGLLVNELISNCLKHGFPEGRSGHIQIQLHAVNGGSQLCLRVSDTGVGLPEDFESRRGQSLGLQLVSDLALQMQGALEIEPGEGATFSVTFAAYDQEEPADAA